MLCWRFNMVLLCVAVHPDQHIRLEWVVRREAPSRTPERTRLVAGIMIALYFCQSVRGSMPIDKFF